MSMVVKCAYAELRDVVSLVPHPRNANVHPPEQIKLLARIMKYQGVRHPIVVSKRSGLICAGMGRLEAAKLNGWTQFPVDLQDFENEAQELAFLISDNTLAELAETDQELVRQIALDLPPDFELDLLAIPDFKIEEPKVFEGNEDEVPEHVEPIAKLGDVFLLGEHRLMCGDSTSIDAVEKLMNGEKADMVFTDPPYGIDEETDRAFASRTRLAEGNSFKKIAGDTSIDTAVKAFKICNDLSNTICYWGGNYYAQEMPNSPSWIVWDKRVEENQRDMNSDCELAYVKHPNKKSVRIFRHLWKGMIKDSEHGQGRIHPTQKPIALAEWSFNELSPESKNILDIFGGSGSTLIACEKTNRKCFMMELDPHYCDVIIARWENFTGKKAVLSV